MDISRLTRSGGATLDIETDVGVEKGDHSDLCDIVVESKLYDTTSSSTVTSVKTAKPVNALGEPSPEFAYAKHVMMVDVSEIRGWKHGYTATGLIDIAKTGDWEGYGINPIEVHYFPGKGYYVADGHHRYNAVSAAIRQAEKEGDDIPSGKFQW